MESTRTKTPLTSTCEVIEFVAAAATVKAQLGDEQGVREDLIGLGFQLVLALGHVGEGDLARDISQCFRLKSKMRADAPRNEGAS